MPVSLAKSDALKEKMERLGIKEKDIKEAFVRSSGKGGQNVNKVSTCVYLKHLPTGTEVKCGRERSQALNRFLARRLLILKIEKKILREESEETKRAEKIRRQKRKRSARAKKKMLENKRRQKIKKSLRAAPRDDETE